MRVILIIAMLVVTLSGIAGAEQAPPTLSAPTADKSKKVSHLLYEVRQQFGSKALSEKDLWRHYRAKIRGDSVQVEVLLKHDVKPSDLSVLQESGGRIELHRDRWVQMVVPLSSLEWFESEPAVAGVYLPHYAEPLGVVSEGLDTLGIPEFHAKGYRGQNTKIAVLDGGFKDYSLYLGTELPYNFHGIYFGDSFENDSKHGTQCAQVGYDVAPSAELWLVQFDTYLQFLAAIDTIRSMGIDVVSCSMGWFGTGWPDGSSVMSQKIEQLKSAGVLWVNAAGNHAKMHWRGTFSDINFDGYHDFTPSDIGNTFYLSSGSVLSASLFWDDYPASDQDFDLELRVSSTNELAAKSNHSQTGTEPPEEALSYTSLVSGNYYLAIKKYSATRDVVMHQYVMEGPSELQYCTESRSILLPGDSKGSLTVGAVPWYASGSIEEFSSRGPTEDNRTKPELVAPDGISVKDGFLVSQVFGTSFSCPHVAGAAAVYLSYRSSVVPSAVTDTFKTMCIDRGVTGPDNTYGWGLLHLRMSNSPPVLLNPGNKTVTEGSLLAFTLSASDPDNDPLTYSAFPLPTGATFISTNGSFIWQPSSGQAGTYPITFTVSDGQATDKKTITITVSKANRPPILTNPGNKVVNENSVLAFTLVASDPDNDHLTYSAVSLPSGASLNSATGYFSWQPAYDQAGAYSITFSVSDGQASDQKTIQITVLNVNRAPVLVNPGNKSVDENTLLSFTLVASDPDNDQLTYSYSPQIDNVGFGTASGAFSWTPTFEQAGVYQVTFAVSDGQTVDQESITITVNNVNRPPSSFVLLSPKNGDTVESSSVTLRWRRAVDPDVSNVVKYKLLYAKSQEPLLLPMLSSVVVHPECVTEGSAFVPPLPRYPSQTRFAAGTLAENGSSQDSTRKDFDKTVEGWKFSPTADSAWVNYICAGSECDHCTEMRRTAESAFLSWGEFDGEGCLKFAGNHQGFRNSACDYEFWQRIIYTALPTTWRGVDLIEMRVFNGSDSELWAACMYFDSDKRRWNYIETDPNWISLGKRTWKAISFNDSAGRTLGPIAGIGLNFGAYHHEDTVYVDWIQGIGAQSEPKWQDSVSNIADTAFVMTSFSQRYHYYWKVVAYDNENASTDCSNGTFSFLVADMTPPTFTIGILPNPVLPFELDIFGYPSEELKAVPQARITSPSGSHSYPMTLLANRELTGYVFDYQIGQGGQYTISICGSDLSDNQGCTDELFAASRIYVGNGTVLTSPSGTANIAVPAGSCSSDGVLICTENSSASSETPELGLPDGAVPLKTLLLKSSSHSFHKPLLVSIDLRRLEDCGTLGSYVGVYQMTAREQRWLVTRYDFTTGAVTTEISETGTYVLCSRSNDESPVTSGSVPVAFQLDQNSPNPFNEGTRIGFSILTPVRARIDIFNLLGQMVTTLLDEDVPAGNYSVSWNGKDWLGKECSSGVYLYRLSAGEFTATKKMLFLK